MLIREIVKKGSTRIKWGAVLLRGVQINNGPDTPDYFVPLRFDYKKYSGEIVEDMLPSLKKKSDLDFICSLMVSAVG